MEWTDNKKLTYQSCDKYFEEALQGAKRTYTSRIWFSLGVQEGFSEEVMFTRIPGC